MNPRPAVARFAQLMEERLAANDHKGGWERESFAYLVECLFEEVLELETAIQRNVDDAVREAADVANFAMMIADKLGYEPPEKRTQ